MMNRAVFWKSKVVVICVTAASAIVPRASAQISLEPPANRASSQRAESAAEQEIPAPADPADVAARPPLHGPGYLGVTFEPQIRNAAVVQSVHPNSPAEQAGLKAGDTIEAINGRRVASYQNVLDAVAAMQAGQRIDIDYSRRIDVRTQAVLDVPPPQERRTAGYRPQLAPTASIPPRSVAEAPEPLPLPANVGQDRPRAGQQYSTNRQVNANPQDGPRGQSNANAGTQQRSERRFLLRRGDDDDSDRRATDRDRGRGYRILPWRRN